jgi:hypothetical protein
MEGIDKTIFKRIFEDHWEEFKTVSRRFDTPWHNQTVRRMLDCGDPDKMGFIQYRCPSCGETRRIAFTCKSCFCLSCSKVYTDRWADFVGRRLFPGVVYRHVVFTMPDFLAIRFYQNPALLEPLMRTGHACLKDIFKTYSGQELDLGTIIVLQTAGRSGHYNPHLHILVTGGGINPQGQWTALSYVPFSLFHKKWQYHLLTMLRKNGSYPAIRKDIDRAWKDYPNGFVAFLEKGEVPPGGQGLAQYLAKYVVSPPISVRRIEQYDGQTVRYWYHDHKSGKIQHETLPVLRFIGRMVQHILPKGFQRIRYYGLHGNVRYQKMRPYLALILPASAPDDPRGYRVLPRTPFAQLFFKSFGRDPLLCPRCGHMMERELIQHPAYGTILDEWDNLFTEEMPCERSACTRRSAGLAEGQALGRAERMVQISLPFL